MYKEINNLLDIDPYSLRSNHKDRVFKKIMRKLNKYHFDNCDDYRKLITFLVGNYKINDATLEGMKYIPVSLFKSSELSSVKNNDIHKILLSSGTSGLNSSKIYLSQNNTNLQTRVLNLILRSFTNNKRLPMLVIDSKDVLKRGNNYTARIAAILGFSMVGKDITFGLDSNMNVDENAISKFIDKYGRKEFLIFGFTFILWEYLYKIFLNSSNKLDLTNAIIFHGGGWKKLENVKITNDMYNIKFKELFNVDKIYNYYGLVEQTGSIFVECNYGYLHCSNFSDIFIRDEEFNNINMNNRGLVQLMSLLPISYPGHNILTEDIGEIFGVDNCRCGRLGKYFKIYGRLERREIRGCSDSY